MGVPAPGPLRYARPRMTPPRVRLGDLLVDAQIVTREQLEEVLALQRQDGRRLGTLLVESGLVTETQVTQILSQQLSVPWVSLYHIDFSRQLLNLVPRETAEKYCLVPIFVRRVRGLGETLYVAMDDPSDEAAQRDVSQYAGLPVRAMIAPPSDIRSAIRVYYGAGTTSSSLSEAEAEVARSAEPEQAEAAPEPGGEAAPQAAPSSEPRVDAPAPEAHAEPAPEPEASAPVEAAAASEVAADEPASSDAVAATSAPEPAPGKLESIPPESGPRIEAREVSMPAPKKGARVKMISLTLLDGTEINLPARGSAQKQTAPAEGEQLTARDLVAALRAVSHGADATEILGENARWEAMFAALLSVLLKKHLIADWEFVEEFRKI
jgi:type IV pilus assembly protein PilB